MTRFWVATDTSFEVEADDVQETEEGKLVFYIEGEPVAEIPDGLWLEYGVADNG